ncbi:MAG TPA: hypothetical protein VF267_01960 [Gammaproteobacteria bacterium]
MNQLNLDVFGRRMLAERDGKGWRLTLAGTDGKRRPVPDLVIPENVRSLEDLLQFLDDHFHEYATARNSAVRVIETR